MRAERPDGSLLAGVCAGIAQAFKWNVWALRVLFVGFLFFKTIAAVLVYAGLALLLYLFRNDWGQAEEASESLASPELSRRDQRIKDLEKRFKDLKESERS
jgi:phage shock protein PspC (stress-responsive transcriptional regulator)